MVKSIHIIGKREIVIDYNYQDEYETAAQIGGIPATVGKGDE